MKKLILGIAGLFVGGVIGFLLRPSAFLVGQLPFGTVIARGSNLSGMDRLLISTAETSFNYMMVGAVLGGVVGVVIGLIAFRDEPQPSA
jgi:hypothetical protein